MNIQQWIKVFIVSGSIVTLTACSHARKNPDESAVNEANAAYSSAGAETSGLGHESGFGDRSHGGERVAAKRVYYFDFDSNVVHDQDRPAAAANANYLASNPNVKVLMEGHTDPRGSREYNIGLGERRAKAVGEILTSNGVKPSQVRIVSYGAEKLASLGHTENAYQLDRRVVLVYLKR